MSAFEEQPCVGLFGTRGKTTFRKDLFIPAYETLGINYFNPQVDDWKPELAEIESDHLAYDVVQCWPVLGSTYGTGSLGEQGYAVDSTLRTPSPLPKFVIAKIDMDLDPDQDDKVARKESVRARQLLATHLNNNMSPNVFVVETLQEMLEASVVLYGVASQITELSRSNNPAYRQFVEGRNERIAYAEAIQKGLLGKQAAELTYKK